MRKLAVLTFVTLDGVMQGPASVEEDTSGGFSHGGWAVDYWSEVMEQVMEEAMATPYDLLLGRKTYDSFAAHWTQAGDSPASDVMNNATKYVATSTLGELEWKNSIRISGDIATKVARLKNAEGPLLQVHGSWQLIQTLLEHGLVDEFRLWIFPVVVGSGRRLFGPDTVPIGLSLVKTRACSNGAMMCIYRLASKSPPSSEAN